MKKLLFTANILMVLALVSCNQKTEPKAETTTPEVTAAPAKMEVKVSDLATNKDFVCGMEVADGSIADTASFEGKLYGFCSVECKAEFAKDPAAYLAQK